MIQQLFEATAVVRSLGCVRALKHQQVSSTQNGSNVKHISVIKLLPTSDFHLLALALSPVVTFAC